MNAFTLRSLAATLILSAAFGCSPDPAPADDASVGDGGGDSGQAMDAGRVGEDAGQTGDDAGGDSRDSGMDRDAGDTEPDAGGNGGCVPIGSSCATDDTCCDDGTCSSSPVGQVCVST